jgi:hypothetical protein
VPLQTLSLQTLNLLDMGKVAETLAVHLSRAALDCEDRPGDPTPRRVVLSMALSPQTSPEGDLEDVKGQFFVESKVPSHRTKVYSFGVRRTPGRGVALVWNEDSPTNIRQGTMLPDEEPGD